MSPVGVRASGISHLRNLCARRISTTRRLPSVRGGVLTRDARATRPARPSG